MESQNIYRQEMKYEKELDLIRLIQILWKKSIIILAPMMLVFGVVFLIAQDSEKPMYQSKYMINFEVAMPIQGELNLISQSLHNAIAEADKLMKIEGIENLEELADLSWVNEYYDLRLLMEEIDGLNAVIQKQKNTETHINSVMKLITTDEVLADIISELGLTFPESDLRSMIVVEREMVKEKVVNPHLVYVKMNNTDEALSKEVLDALIASVIKKAEADNLVVRVPQYTFVDTVRIDTPVAMKNASIAAILVGMCLVGYFTIKFYLNTNINSEEEVKSFFRLPVLAEVSSNKKRYIDDLNESVNAVRTEGIINYKDEKVIQITDFNAVDHKMLFAVKYAKSLAKLGNKVLLVDANVQNPSLDFVQFKKGIIEATLNIEKWQSTVVKLEQDEIDVLGCEKVVSNGSDFISTESFRKVISAARNEYDYVIIVSNQIIGNVEASIVANIADITVILLKEDSVKYNVAISKVEELKRRGIKIMGFVWSKA